MTASIDDLAASWLPWLNQVLGNHSLPLRASRAPDDEDSDSEGEPFPILIHIHSLRRQQHHLSTPAMIGLIADNDLTLDETNHNINAFLSDHIFFKQVETFRTNAPFRCFIARANGRMSFYSVSAPGVGQNGASRTVDVVEHGSYVRSGSGRAGRSEQMLVDGVKHNLAQMAGIAPRFYQQTFL